MDMLILLDAFPVYLEMLRANRVKNVTKKCHFLHVSLAFGPHARLQYFLMQIKYYMDFVVVTKIQSFLPSFLKTKKKQIAFHAQKLCIML